MFWSSSISNNTHFRRTIVSFDEQSEMEWIAHCFPTMCVANTEIFCWDTNLFEVSNMYTLSTIKWGTGVVVFHQLHQSYGMFCLLLLHVQSIMVKLVYIELYFVIQMLIFQLLFLLFYCIVGPYLWYYVVCMLM